MNPTGPQEFLRPGQAAMPRRPGFKVPDDLRKTDDIMSVPVGTDPGLAMQTRHGTSFYKVPSLRGVWYRNAFGHSGLGGNSRRMARPRPLKEDYVPKGFHLGPGPIKGHEFGLKLSSDDKAALIAFLKTPQPNAASRMSATDRY